jgi:PKD repeat protein
VSVISASTLRGTAPLAVNFSGAGSSDPDGSVVAYAWNFGDGGTGNGVSVSHGFGTPGSYTVQLQVTDNSGLSSASAVTVTVDAPVVLLDMRVADIAMSLTVAKNGSAKAGAAVKVLDASGQPVAGASVAGNWSGLATGSATATTDSTGLARFTSGASRAATGSFVFTVTGVTRSGYTYQPTTNTETRDAITR